MQNLQASFKEGKKISFNPFTPTNDQDRISPYNINTISSRQVMRIEKNINHGIILGFDIPFWKIFRDYLMVFDGVNVFHD